MIVQIRVQQRKLFGVAAVVGKMQYAFADTVQEATQKLVNQFPPNTTVLVEDWHNGQYVKLADYNFSEPDWMKH